MGRKFDLVPRDFNRLGTSLLGLPDDLESINIGTRRQGQATLARGESASSFSFTGLCLASPGFWSIKKARVEAVRLLRVATALGRILLDGAIGLAIEEEWLLLVISIVVHLTLP